LAIGFKATNADHLPCNFSPLQGAIMNTLLFDDLEPILDFALALYDLGFSISPPIPPRSRFPCLPWKEYQTVRASKKQLIDWAFDYPYFSYGVITGALSGVVCLDADSPDAEAVISKHCPLTPMRQVSGSGRGQHHLYRHPGGHVPTGASIKVHGVEVGGLDLRGDGGLFVGPGSLHRRTKLPYRMVEPWTKEMLAGVPVFDLNWLGITVEPQKSSEPSPGRGDIRLSRKQELAREMLKAKAPAKSGDNSEGYCMALASALVHGYDLPPDEAIDLFLEWGEKEGNIDSEGRYWTRAQLMHKLTDAASQEDPQGRPRGYLLPAWDQQAVEALFDRREPRKPFKAPLEVAELSSELLGPDCRAHRTYPAVAEPEPSTSQAAPQQPALDPDDPLRRFADDPRTAYLWKGFHANDANVRPAERLARSKSVLEAYRMIPPTGLLADFLATYLPTTDCSCTLLLGAGLALAASLLNRQVWISQGNKRLHPHLWCGLVAASGERKSTAVNLVANLLKRDADYHAVCLASDSTWPALAPRLGVEVKPGPGGEPDWLGARLHCERQPEKWLRGVGTLCIDELGGWLKSLNAQVNQGLLETLTGMYESPPEILKETKTAGCHYIWRPCLTILAASTDAWLSENVSESILRGGFLGRWLFFVSAGPDYKLPRCDPPDPDAEQRLLPGIERLKAASGEVKVCNQAWDEYAAWVKGLSVSERLASFRSRFENAALKIALIYEVTQGGSTVRVETMRLATGLVDWLAAQAETFAEEKFVFDPAQKNIARVRQVLSAHGELLRSELLRLARLTAKQLDEALATLFQTEAVTERDVPGKGRTGKAYRVVG
jgi:Bifunctional DNA primase/polymerase, N-terminal/Protein of unknown function (DUF3987)